MSRVPILAITVGDPNGIGPEIILKSLSDPAIRAICQPLLVGPLEVFNYYNQKLDNRLKFLRLISAELIPSDPDCVPIWEPSNFEDEIEPGAITRIGGHVAGIAIEEACLLAMKGRVDGIVTAPVSKEALLMDGYPAPGHTDLLANVAGVEEAVTMLVWEQLRCALYSLHQPLRKVPELIDRDKIVRKLRVIDSSITDWFGIVDPKIGMCGLNPHASDGGLFGREDISALAPAVEKAQREGIMVTGPLAADVMFLNWQNFDCLFALYHDQGVTPSMIISGGKACYMTLGLPFLRVAPGHGTAFDIAGKMIADHSKMSDAIHMASRLIIERRERNLSHPDIELN